MHFERYYEEGTNNNVLKKFFLQFKELNMLKADFNSIRTDGIYTICSVNVQHDQKQ